MTLNERQIKRRRTIKTVAVVVVSVMTPLLLLAGCGYTLLAPKHYDGFSLDRAACAVEPVTHHAFLELHLTAESIGNQIQLESLDTGDLKTVGYTALDGTLSLQSVPLEDIRKRMKADDRGTYLHSRTGDLVLELTRTANAQHARLDKVTLWYSPGEPAFLQDIPINLRWTSNSCSVEPDATAMHTPK